MIERIFGIAGSLYRGAKPARDDAYLKFIRKFPCLGCGRTSGIDACHTGPHGISQKASDLSCIPLCRKCHKLFDAAPRDWATKKDLLIPEIIQYFNRLYERRAA